MSTFFWDTLERLARTFAQAFLATLTAAQFGIVDFVNTSLFEQALLAGLAAVLSLAMCWLSRWLSKDPNSASAIPAKTGAA